MSFNFTAVQRGKLGGYQEDFPENTIRISKRTLSFGEDVAKLFTATSYKTKVGDSRAKVSLAYDLYNQAIQITPAGDGFAINIAENGRGNGVLPANFRKAGLPMGDYKLVTGERHVFQLAR